MKRLKVLLALVVCFTMCVAFGLSVSAETEGTGEVVDVPEVETPALPEFEINIKYTSDSVLFKGVDYRTFVDVTTGEYWVEIVKDFDIGYSIYDSKDTPHIDGIRINNETVDVLKYKLTDGETYNIVVKVSYTEGLLGDIAKMSDGIYDWSELLTNPVIILQAVYYVLAVISVIVTITWAMLGKNKKVKSSDEIANKVSEAATDSFDKIKASVIDTVLTEFTPIFQGLLDKFENVVKAITLSTSKDKNAPVALLDVLQDAAKSTDAQAIIESVKQELSSHFEVAEATKNDNLAALHEMVESTVTVQETPSEHTVETVHRSVF